MIEILTTERDFVAELTDDQKKVYFADNKQLVELLWLCNDSIRHFVDISTLLNNLHAAHEKLNNAFEAGDDDMLDVIFDNFNIVLTITTHSAVLSMISMDDCDALYRFLSKIKMNAYNNMFDHVSIEQLVSRI